EQRVRQGAFREDLFHRLNVIRLRLPALRERREDIPSLARSFLQKSAKELGVETKRLSEAALGKLVAFDYPGNVRQLENVCHWLTVMAPAQLVDAKDLPPELLGTVTSSLTMHDDAAPVLRPQDGPADVPAGVVQAPAGLAALMPQPPAGVAASVLPNGGWLHDLEREARALLEAGVPNVWEVLTQKFEAQLIHSALDVTRGRRIEAAHKLGIGRNTITRKIQELGLDD
ncbi:helix-turn-helix domain-containing protein, partial [Methylibium sp.]|uniref:helix-turn-helix domain-containing protein n=1 Tax=Methylibium sp. TaxID=2067992 RepID=UPI0017B94677